MNNNLREYRFRINWFLARNHLTLDNTSFAYNKRTKLLRLLSKLY